MEIDHPGEQPKAQCKHARCTCAAEAGHPYCSEYCRSAAEFTEEPSLDEDVVRQGQCGCGHSECRSR